MADAAVATAGPVSVPQLLATQGAAVACTASELAHWHGMSQKSVQPATEAADVMQGIYSWLVSVMKGMKRLKGSVLQRRLASARWRDSLGTGRGLWQPRGPRRGNKAISCCGHGFGSVEVENKYGENRYLIS